eukprot:10424-Heterococcus_DN1.PRE.2
MISTEQPAAISVHCECASSFAAAVAAVAAAAAAAAAAIQRCAYEVHVYVPRQRAFCSTASLFSHLPGRHTFTLYMRLMIDEFELDAHCCWCCCVSYTHELQYESSYESFLHLLALQSGTQPYSAHDSTQPNNNNHQHRTYRATLSGSMNACLCCFHEVYRIKTHVQNSSYQLITSTLHETQNTALSHCLFPLALKTRMYS